MDKVAALSSGQLVPVGCVGGSTNARCPVVRGDTVPGLSSHRGEAQYIPPGSAPGQGVIGAVRGAVQQIGGRRQHAAVSRPLERVKHNLWDRPPSPRSSAARGIPLRNALAVLLEEVGHSQCPVSSVMSTFSISWRRSAYSSQSRSYRMCLFGNGLGGKSVLYSHSHTGCMY